VRVADCGDAAGGGMVSRAVSGAAVGHLADV
jgi:hypothetical protein